MTDFLDSLAHSAAKELERQAQKARSGTPWVDAVDLKDANIDGHVDLTLVVRAVLSAMREPTEAMVRAAFNTRGREFASLRLREQWTNMIDAALSETNP